MRNQKLPSSTDTLVIAGPHLAVQGPDLKLIMQWSLVDLWQGPVFILENDDICQSMTAAGRSYRAVLDERCDQREATGEICRLKTGGIGDGLLHATVSILASTDQDAHYTITGAWAETGVATVARIIFEKGREASIDASAIWSEDVDHSRNEKDAARLAALMAQVRGEHGKT